MEAFSVSQFIEFLNAALTTAVFPEGAAVEGEVVEYRVSQGKWIWFSLKDDSGLVSCFATTWGLRQPLEDGMQVRAYGRPKVHPKSGRFSLNVDRVEAVGEGALQRAFQLLRSKLEAEGLFSQERKRPLPQYPERIGLIASAESAAYGDFMRILANRWGGVDIALADVAVQGRNAPGQIVGAFERFNRMKDPPELLVLVRGGGSLEDLQAFNTEEVCRAVFGANRPVVVGVGHERDVSLADMAADVRAATPTNAAEIVFPDREEVMESLESSRYRIATELEGLLATERQVVTRLVHGLDVGLRQPTERLDGLARQLMGRLSDYAQAVRQQGSDLERLASALDGQFGQRLFRLRQAVAARKRMLVGLDPKRLLRQGYAIVRSNRQIVRQACTVRLGDSLDIQLYEGKLKAKVTENKHAKKNRK